MRHCWTASDYYINCCWNVCFSSAHVQHGSWPVDHYRLAGGLKFHIVHAPGNITVPKKCHCTQTKKLLLHFKVRRLSQWFILAVLFSFTTFRCQPDLLQGFSAGLWVTGNRIIQTSWISLAQVHQHQNFWTEKSTEETIRPCTNKVKVTWPMSGQLKHLHLMIKELYCTNMLYTSPYKKAPPTKHKQILIMFLTPNSSNWCDMSCDLETVTSLKNGPTHSLLKEKTESKVLVSS